MKALRHVPNIRFVFLVWTAGGHNDSWDRVGHRGNGYQADCGPPGNCGRLPHGHLLLCRPRVHPPSSQWLPLRHPLPPPSHSPQARLCSYPGAMHTPAFDIATAWISLSLRMCPSLAGWLLACLPMTIGGLHPTGCRACRFTINQVFPAQSMICMVEFLAVLIDRG